MVLKLCPLTFYSVNLFENDVKQYGTQANTIPEGLEYGFENDVKQYGTQALVFCLYG